MRKIIFYKLNRQVKSEEKLNKENLYHINVMKTKCAMSNGTEEVGFADPTGVYNKEIYDGKVKDYIYLWTWDNLDENEGKLIGNDDKKFNQTFKAVKIDDIEKVEAITYSNHRWGGKFTNKFEFYSNDACEKEFEIPQFLINKSKENCNEDKRDEEKVYLFGSITTIN